MSVQLTPQELAAYTERQAEQLTPLPARFGRLVTDDVLSKVLERLQYCVQGIALPGWQTPNGDVPFNIFHTDQYCLYLLYLANELWLRDHTDERAARIYILNKALHGLNCVYDAQLPSRMLVAHPVGSVLGKAVLPENLVVAQGCTIGAISGAFPTLGEGLVLSAGAAVIGRCTIGRDVTIGAYTAVVKTDVPDGMRVQYAAEKAPAYMFTPTNAAPQKHYFKPRDTQVA